MKDVLLILTGIMLIMLSLVSVLGLQERQKLRKANTTLSETSRSLLQELGQYEERHAELSKLLAETRLMLDACQKPTPKPVKKPYDYQRRFDKEDHGQEAGR